MRDGTQFSNGNVTAWIGHERLASLHGVVALAALLAWLGAGCSESNPTPADGGAPSVFETYFYDFTTHELVGVTYSARIWYACGDGGGGFLRAGATVVDPSCARTKYVNRCPDRGDASTDD